MAQTAVARREDEQLPLAGIPEPQPVSILAVIERAARDPQVDADKMERMMALYERVNAANAKASYTKALAEMQPNLPEIRERGEIKIRDDKPGQKYALWEDINEQIRPVLAEHGFALSFRTGQAESKITVTGVLSHRDGHSEETTMHLPADTSGSKNAVQAVGSSVSYGKRYTASALLNLTSRGEDDDGRGAGAGGTLSDDQIEKVFDLIKATKADTGKFCEYMKVQSVPDILAKDYERAITALNLKAKAVHK